MAEALGGPHAAARCSAPLYKPSRTPFKEGLATARARGRLLGRPKGSLGPSKLDGKEGEIRMLLGKKVPKA